MKILKISYLKQNSAYLSHPYYITSKQLFLLGFTLRQRLFNLKHKSAYLNLSTLLSQEINHSAQYDAQYNPQR